jgi:hypothetical protein
VIDPKPVIADDAGAAAVIEMSTNSVEVSVGKRIVMT